MFLNFRIFSLGTVFFLAGHVRDRSNIFNVCAAVRVISYMRSVKKSPSRIRFAPRTRQRFRQRLVVASLLLFFLISGVVFVYMNLGDSREAYAVANISWNGNISTDWNTAGNWSPANVPGASDNVTIPNRTNQPVLSANVSVQNLTLNNGSNLKLNGKTLTVTGTFNQQSGGALDLEGGILNASGNAYFSPGTIADAAGTGSVNLTGPTASIGAGGGTLTFAPPLTVNCNAISLRNTVFQSTVDIRKTGGGNDASAGGNTFQAALTCTLQAGGYFVMSNSNGDVYNADVTITNNSSGTFYLSHGGTSTFNGNVTLNNTSTGGFQIGASGGTSNFAADKTFLTSGFSGGPLTMNRVNQSGSSASTFTASLTNFNSTNAICIAPISLVCSGTANITNGTFYNDFSLEANDINLGQSNRLATVSGNVSIKKKGGSSNTWTGGNQFGNAGGTVSIIHQGGGNLALGGTNGDTINAPMTLTNATTSGIFYFAHNGSSYASDDIAVNCSSTGGIYIGQSNGRLTFAQDKALYTESHTRGPLYIRNLTESGVTSRTIDAATGACTFNNCYVTTNVRVVATGQVNLQNSDLVNDVNFSAPDFSFSGGNLLATQSGDAQITFTGVSGDYWNGGNTLGNSSGVIRITNNGSGQVVVGNGSGDTYNTDVILSNNTPSSIFYFAHAGTNTFSGDVQLNNTSTGGVQWGASNGTSTFAAGKVVYTGEYRSGPLQLWRITQSGTTDKVIQATPTIFQVTNSTLITAINVQCTASSTLSGSNLQGNVRLRATDITLSGANQLATQGDSIVLEKTGNTGNAWTGGNTFGKSGGYMELKVSSNGQLVLANSTRDIFLSNVAIRNQGSGILYVAHNDNSGTVFSGDLELSNSGTGSIRFGQSSGTTILATGKQLIIRDSVFTSGDLYLRRFTQLGSTAINIDVRSGTGAIYFQGSTVFNGTLSLAFPQVYLNGSTFNGSTRIEKTGATDNNSSGDNTYNGPVLLANSGTGAFNLAVSNPDDYNAAATFQQHGSGAMNPAYNNSNTFAGDISTLGTTTAITFGAGSGTVRVNGATAQTFSNEAGKPANVRRLTMSSTGGGLVLNGPLTVSASMNLSSGIITTTDNNLLTIANGFSGVSNTSNTSYVNGPVRKTGNQSFTFPVGKNGYYRPVSISAPSVATDQFIAEYFQVDPASFSDVTRLEAALNRVSRCEYWNLRRNAGSSNVNVTLSWNTTSCGVSIPSQLRVARWDSTGTMWRNQGNGGISGNPTSGTMVSTPAVTQFGQFTLGSSTANNALPIELSAFSAEAAGESVLVRWETMSEINNDYFSVERSADGENFEVLKTLPGAGNTTERKNYQWLDEQPLEGISFYRLRQTDYDGKYEVFDPVSVKRGEASEEFRLMSTAPNPFSEQFKAVIYLPQSGDVVFDLSDVNGSSVFNNRLPATNGVSVLQAAQLSHLQAGFYLLRIFVNDELKQSVKLLKQ